VAYERRENFTYIAFNGDFIIKISNDSFFLDVSKLYKSSALAKRFDVSCRYALSKTEDMCIYTDHVLNYKKISKFGHFKKNIIKHERKEAYVFESEKGNVYADKKRLKNLKVSDAELFTSEDSRYIYFVKDNQVYAVMSSLPLCK
nr:hypothetical protein [Ruminococcus sp.]